MPRCKNCGHFGFFTKLNKNGLCSQCAPIIDQIISNCARLMKDSINNIDKTADRNAKLSYCKMMFENATRLQEYENKGIRTIKPHPSIFIEECSRIKQELYQNSLRQTKT